jgi:predicted nucleic acid-binding protein
MTVLDAYALVSFLVGGPAASEVRGILRDGNAAVATANLAEVLDVSQRIYGVSITRAMEVIDPLLESALALIPLDLAIARGAAGVRARYYRRSSRPISLADAVLIASATPQDRIATADPDVLAVADSEGVQSVTLPAPA